jgi:hypothetical protein
VPKLRTITNENTGGLQGIQRTHRLEWKSASAVNTKDEPRRSSQSL